MTQTSSLILVCIYANPYIYIYVYTQVCPCIRVRANDVGYVFMLRALFIQESCWLGPDVRTDSQVLWSSPLAGLEDNLAYHK